MANCNYKVKIKDIQNKYRFKIFCATNLSNFYTKDEVNNLLDDKANISDLDNYELLSNKVTSIDENSTDTQYPSAKGVYNSQEEQNEMIIELETELQETKEENTYLNSVINQLPKVSGSGTSVTLDNTIQAKLTNTLSPSEMTQEDTPTPSTPQQIHTISGDNTLVVGNKNSFNSYVIDTIYTQISEDGTINISNVSTSNGFCDIHKNLKELCSSLKVGDEVYLYIDTDFYEGSDLKSYIYIRGVNISWRKDTSRVITEEMLNGDVVIYGGYQTTSHLKIMITKQLETSYEPHQEQTAQLNLGDLEYSAIGNYKDEFIRATNETGLVSGKWYLKKNIKKYTFTGEESWGSSVNSNNYRVFQHTLGDTIKAEYNVSYTNYFSFIWDYNTNTECYYLSTIAINIAMNNEEYSSNEIFKNWLSTHNVEFYCVLATPEYILLNDTLQEQLDIIESKLLSYKGQTSISQVNDDLPFVITSSAIMDLNTLVTRLEIIESEV